MMIRPALLMGMLVSGVAIAQPTMRVHVPASLGSRPAPLLVVLHGCAQGASGIAKITGFDEAADSVGFVVLYPEQPATANPARCWNWFEPAHQRRGGEPAAIVALIDSVRHMRPIDSARVYIAGLSAGGAMAVNIASLYPDRFAGVMSHSGIAVGAAASAAAAFGVMQKGPAPVPLDSVRARIGAPRSRPPMLLVVQGDADVIVNPANAPALRLQWEKAGGTVKQVTVPGLGHTWAPIATKAALDFFRLLK